MKSLVFYLIYLIGFSLLIQSSVSKELPIDIKDDLVSLCIPLENDTLVLYTDTGGKNFLYKSGLMKLNGKKSPKKLWEKSNIEKLFVEKEIPIPYIKEIYYIKEKSSVYDGILGREWFANRIWEFDYENKTLKELYSQENMEENLSQTLSLFLKTDLENQASYHLPRIEIVVKSDTLSMLFDTGAQAYLSEEAQDQLNKNELVATSFINASTFECWTKNHPEWRIISGGDLSLGERADIIIVPEIQIGNMCIGPVEFVKRADSNFDVMSTLFMDKEIVGALGGNALSKLKHFILDYRSRELKIQN